VFGFEDRLTLTADGTGRARSVVLENFAVESVVLYSRSGRSFQCAESMTKFLSSFRVLCELEPLLCSIDVHRFKSAVAMIPEFIPIDFKIGGMTFPLDLY
jgi:hypothetical protein